MNPLVLILSLQVLTLLALGALLWPMEKAPPAPVVLEPVPPSPIPAPPSGAQVHAMMRRNAAGEWEHDGRWVREGSELWDQAYETPGIALRAHGPDGRIIEGKQ